MKWHEAMPPLYEETEEMRANPRYHGPCALCGFPVIIPEGEVWGFAEEEPPFRHPWQSMCLVRLRDFAIAHREATP